MATEDYLSGRAIDVAQYCGTAIADVAEIIGSVGGRGAAKAAEAVYGVAPPFLDGALRIGNKREPIAPDVVVRTHGYGPAVGDVPAASVHVHWLSKASVASV
jgi:hypothetical protein